MPAAFITSESVQAAELVSGSRRWTTGSVLVELARRGFEQGDRFTTLDLEQWLPEAFAAGRVRRAMVVCIRSQFVTNKMSAHPETGRTISTYTITALGAEAIRAAALGKLPKGGARATGNRATHQPGSFGSRLWALLRARRQLDPLTAAETLVDAGGDVHTAARTASGYLSRWTAIGAVAEGRKREANGFKRYVLVQDSPNPPQRSACERARANQSTRAPQ